ncbi:viral A-type inclusion protein [Diplonema papillatum]|nr:viral A-type inclusion protein [Diplonema papillatum]
MPNAGDFQVGLDPDLARMLGSEEEDKRRFFAEEASSANDTSATPTASSIPRGSQQSNWGRIFHPAADGGAEARGAYDIQPRRQDSRSSPQAASNHQLAPGESANLALSSTAAMVQEIKRKEEEEERRRQQRRAADQREREARQAALAEKQRRQRAERQAEREREWAEVEAMGRVGESESEPDSEMDLIATLVATQHALPAPDEAPATAAQLLAQPAARPDATRVHVVTPTAAPSAGRYSSFDDAHGGKSTLSSLSPNTSEAPTTKPDTTASASEHQKADVVVQEPAAEQQQQHRHHQRQQHQQQQQEQEEDAAGCSNCAVLETRLSTVERQLEKERLSAKTEQEDVVARLVGEVDTLRGKLGVQMDRVVQLETENELLNAKVEGRSIRQDIAKGALDLITRDEMREIAREIRDQEALIRASQHEDAKNNREIKALRQQLAEVRRELLEYEKQRPRGPPDQSGDTTPIGAGSPQPDGTAQVVKDLHRDNTRLKEALRIRQEEHGVAVHALQRANRDLQAKLATVDWQRTQDDELAIRDLKVQLASQAQAHADDKRELEEKLRWYIQNQELLSRHDELVERQGTEIEALKSRVVELDSEAVSSRKRGVGGPLDYKKYVSELQKKVKGLEDIIKNKYPNSIPELIRACKPTETEVKMYSVMQDRIASLTQELSDREEEYEKGIRQLRQEADKVHLDNQGRIAALKEELKLKVRNATSGRVKELERTVEDTRAYYMKKVRELEAQVLEFRKAQKKTQAQKPGESPSAKKPADGGPPPSANHPRRVASTQTAHMGPVGGEGGQPSAPPGFSPGTAIQYVPTGYPAQDMGFVAAEMARLRMEVDACKKAESDAQAQLAASKEVVGQTRGQWEAEASLRRSLESDVKALQRELDGVQRSHEAEVHRLLSTHRVDLDEQKMKWEKDVKNITQSLQQKHFDAPVASLSKQQRMDYLGAVRRKLESVEFEYAVKQSDLQRALDETKRMSAFEMDVQKQKLNLIIQSKNNELQKFRLALDSLLDELETLREQQRQREFARSTTTA